MKMCVIKSLGGGGEMISHLFNSTEDHQCSALTMHPKRLFYILDQLFLDRYGSDVFLYNLYFF